MEHNNKSNVGKKSKDACCGCTACSNICPMQCIIMQADSEGFRYPIVNENLCINCGVCLKVCPWEHFDLSQPQKVFAVKAKNKETQYLSSSGGAFIEIARKLINEGYHLFGASYSYDFTKVQHIQVDNTSDLNSLIGSKYVQSDLRDVFLKIRTLLNSKEFVLFSGTGCQVAGLKSFLRKEYDNLFTIDILCHGVPSPRLYEQFIYSIKSGFGEIKSINMKDKSDGWGHQKIRIMASKDVPVDVSQIWSKIFYSRLAMRPSCYKCKFMTINRPGDISLGDYWGIEKIAPEFTDKSGVSLVLINNSKGRILFNTIQDKLICLETNKEDCIQPVLTAPIPAPEWRNGFWSYYNRFGFKDTVQSVWGYSFGNPILLDFCHFIKRFFRR